MSNTCPRPRCGGLLVLDYEAGDEWVCARCSTRLYATKPNTGETEVKPMYCIEGCGRRVYVSSAGALPTSCNDCAYVRSTLLFLDTLGIPDRYGRIKAL